MHIKVLSLFPHYIKGPLGESILRRAIEKNILHIEHYDIRDFSNQKDRRVDDRPYGGGPGMVMQPDVVCSALRAVKTDVSKVVYLSPQGTPLTASLARQLSSEKSLILLCGHYEGIDQRAIDTEVDLEVSIGDYVLTNGCLAALVLIDAISRFIPGVLGDELASSQDSFEETLLDCPHYTKPLEFEGKKVPEVLLSGDHEKVKRFRTNAAVEKTVHKRPDLFTSAIQNSGQGESSFFCKNVYFPTVQFEKNVSFYEKILGMKAQKKSFIASFSLKDSSLHFFASDEQIKTQLIEIFVSPEQFLFIWHKVKICCRKNCTDLSSWTEKTLFLSDPDGRVLKICTV